MQLTIVPYYLQQDYGLFQWFKWNSLAILYRKIKALGSEISSTVVMVSFMPRSFLKMAISAPRRYSVSSAQPDGCSHAADQKYLLRTPNHYAQQGTLYPLCCDATVRQAWVLKRYVLGFRCRLYKLLATPSKSVGAWN